MQPSRTFVQSRGGLADASARSDIDCGDAQAIHQFMAALKAHKTLALDAVQFKWERIESSEIEARIQWVLLTRLSEETAVRPAAMASRGGQ
jgi:hypothetical protein